MSDAESGFNGKLVLNVTRVEDASRRRRHDLALFDIGTNTSRLLVSDNAQALSPTYNAQTRRIAVIASTGNGDVTEECPDILLFDPEVGVSARLTGLYVPRFGKLTNPVFSSDGTQLALEVCVEGDPNPDIVVLQCLDRVYGSVIDEETRATLANPLGLGLYSPRFMGDGRRLVHLRNYAAEDALEVCLTDLAVPAPPAGGHQDIYGGFSTRRLTLRADVVWNRSHAIAVDQHSETVFFIRGHSEFEYEQVCAVPCSADVLENPLAARSISELFDHIGALQVAPDGRHVAFSADGGLYVTALDGGDLLQLVAGRDANSTCFTFSPDGRFLAYVESMTTGFAIRAVDRFGARPHATLVEVPSGVTNRLLWI